MSQARTTNFDRLRAIVPGGHLAGLTELQTKALLIYFAYADHTTGEAFPSMETVAKLAGTANVSRARAAVNGLRDLGLLTPVGKRKSRRGSDLIIRRIERPAPLKNFDLQADETPERGTISVPLYDDERGTVSDGKGGRSATGKGDGQRIERGTLTVPRTTQNYSGNNSENKDAPLKNFDLQADETPERGTISVLLYDDERGTVSVSKGGRSATGKGDGERIERGTVSVPRTTQNYSGNCSENKDAQAPPPPKQPKPEPPPAPPIPPRLNTPAFRTAWEEYKKHRREKRAKLNPTAEAKALSVLETFGPDEAIEKINRSIANGWIGVVFAEDRKQAKNHRRAKFTGIVEGLGFR